jgi:asparagine synthase (glutamine-hydrolysing)
MCGIVGALTRSEYPQMRWEQHCELQAHRGPDGHGHWNMSEGGWHYRLSHQRLSIIDLSPAGAQPMTHSTTGSVLSFNGEIYNYIELREELAACGVQVQTHSDTAVLLYALDCWGIERTLPKLNGMWAFAWYSANEHCVYLSRDRMGEKPLYWTESDEGFYFASELKTVLALTGARYRLNMQTVAEYLEQGLLDADEATLLVGVRQVRASSVMRLSAQGACLGHSERQYWSIPEPRRTDVTVHQFAQNLADLFRDAVRIRLRSDVPVGILLSGGLDSSSIAAAAQEASHGVATFKLLSAVSDDPRFDESPFIDRMGQHLGLPVTKVRLDGDPDQLFSLLQTVTWHQEAPLGSFSNVAHYLLMEQAKAAGVTVILSGQGADELLCGYRKYVGFYFQFLFRTRRFGALMRNALGFAFNRTILNQFSFGEARRYLPRWLRRPRRSLLGPALAGFSPKFLGMAAQMTLRERQILDLFHFSVPALNHSEDRMSMACSREIRLPFLDHRLVEMLANAPDHFKLAPGWTKYALRLGLSKLLPGEIAWRKDKQGFVNPQSEWLKTTLRARVLEDFFCPDALIFKHGLIDRSALLDLYDRFCRQPAGSSAIWFKDIFAPIALEVWLRTFQRFIQLDSGELAATPFQASAELCHA